MEVSALTSPSSVSALRGPSPLLRLQSDERLIALTRRGQHAAFEALFSRYQARLLAFCRHMLGSKEDAEDVLQEVFVAAFNAVLADGRAINVRPWLYRIARNRSLNHLRRASAIGVDSMDVHFADGGMSTGEQVMRRESFRLLIGDVQQLPETQRTALLLREIDALSYEQIAQAMETTVPSVKSLLVRARISLAEASEARKLSCEEVRHELGEVAEGLVKITPPARRHLRDCDRCRGFRGHLKENNRALALVLPVGPLLLLKRLVLTKLGASAGAGHVAGAGGATAGAGAAGAGAAGAGAGAAGTSAAGVGAAGVGAGATGAAGGAGGLISAGAGAIATKAAATIAAAALVTAGAVAAGHTGRPVRHHHAAAAVAQTSSATTAPEVVRSTPQPVTSGTAAAVAVVAQLPAHARRGAAGRLSGAGPGAGGPNPKSDRPGGARLAPDAKPAPGSPAVGTAPVAPKPPVSAAPSIEVTTETTALPPTGATTPVGGPGGTPAAPTTSTGTTPTAPATTPPPVSASVPTTEEAPAAPPTAGTEAPPTPPAGEATGGEEPATAGAPETETREPVAEATDGGSAPAGEGPATTQGPATTPAG
ncbi:MAG TPA: sigma-70 family RNA polymerase sigma factor [Solirubrobacteraceae bacterium]|nr:sigma-70 family RNA polymerase sigma factor [Solirubrobacteraceae bacterium]